MATKREVLIQLENIPDDEPLFLLRGQDELAEHTILDWCERANMSNVSISKIQGALQCALKMEDWKFKKTPD